jgi:hypothetical protein
MTRPTALQQIEGEIAAEKAAALGRAGERLEIALAETAALAARLDIARNPVVRQQLAVEYEHARTRAASARLMLIIQREALGLRHHRVVDQQFPEPPRRSLVRP